MRSESSATLAYEGIAHFQWILPLWFLDMLFFERRLTEVVGGVQLHVVGVELIV